MVSGWMCIAHAVVLAVDDFAPSVKIQSVEAGVSRYRVLNNSTAASCLFIASFLVMPLFFKELVGWVGGNRSWQVGGASNVAIPCSRM